MMIKGQRGWLYKIVQLAQHHESYLSITQRRPDSMDIRVYPKNMASFVNHEVTHLKRFFEELVIHIDKEEKSQRIVKDLESVSIQHGGKVYGITLAAAHDLGIYPIEVSPQ